MRLLLAGMVSLVLLTGLVIVFVHVANFTPGGGDRDKVKAGVFKKAAVAADTYLCSDVGKAILEQGGNAVDASIASLLCGGLTSCQSMGIGGGFFMTIYDRASGKSTVIDARETAPGLATEDMFLYNASASSSGPLSIGIPGEVRGYWAAHQKYGRLPWKELFKPVIEMASLGFPVPIGLHKAILDDVELLSTEPSLKVVFMNNKTGQLFKEGEVMKRPQLAETLRVISEEGPGAFYQGSLTNAVMEDLKDIGAIITRKDLENYKVVEKPTLETTLNDGLRVISNPPPGSGAVLTFIINLLDGYNMTSADISTTEKSVLTYHRVTEAFKFAYAKRTDLGDEDFVDVKNLVHNLTSRAYADAIRKLITDNSTHNYQYYGPTFYDQPKTSTSHLSVIDPDGMAVSTTSTINGRFGARLRGLRTGIIWNNEMDDFSTPNITNSWGVYPSPANFIKPGKRPLSSMCPAVVVEPSGLVRGVYGAAGGTMITTATAWVITHNLFLEEAIDGAVSRARLHHQLLAPELKYEGGFNKTILEGLHQLGHNVSEFHRGSSIVQAIDAHRDTEGRRRIYAFSDPRKGGVANGF